MNAPDGFNPIVWDCLKTGCFNYHRHFDIEHFAQCFPRKIGFTDLDAFVELNGHFLIVEFKAKNADLTVGQRIAFERLTAVSANISIVVVRCDYRSSEVFGFKRIFAGKSHDWRECDYDQLIGLVSAWAERVQKNPFLSVHGDTTISKRGLA